MTLTRIARWSLIITPILAGVALLIFGTAGGISVGFGVTLIGIGPTVWLLNWFLRMAFDEEAEKQAASDRARAEREQPPPADPSPPADRPASADSPPPDPHTHPAPRAPQHEHQHPRPARPGRRRRPQ